MNTHQRRLILFVASLAQAVLLLSACQAATTGAATRPATLTPAAGATPRDATATRLATATAPALPTAAPTRTAVAATVPPQVTIAEVTIEVTRPALGTAERPVQLLFPPITSSAVIMQRTETLVAALEAVTGVEFAVGIPDDEATAVSLLCSAPADTIAFLSAAAYTIAHDECDAQAGLVAVHDDGLTWQMGMIVTRPGEAVELADLAGQRWAVADTRSLSTYLYFRARMAESGIEPGEVVAKPEDSSALLALTNDEVEFTTAVFVPPVLPSGRAWVVGETDAEEWRLLGIAPTRSPIGYVLVAGEPDLGGYRLRDARARLFDTTPDIFDTTRILALSEPIPNETVVFGADFPLSLSRQTLATMADFAASEACQTSFCSADFFGWTALAPADDAAYDPIRLIRNTLDLEAADLWSELD